jgi:hypothetical protein
MQFTASRRIIVVMPLPDHPDLIRAFREWGIAPDMLPRGLQRRLLSEFEALYERSGLLLDGQTPPLCQCCPQARVCWEPASPKSRPGEGDGAVSLPWVGPDYPAQDGVVVLGMNFNKASGLPEAFELAAYEHEHFALGEKKMGYGNWREVYAGSLFAYRSTRSAAAALDWIDAVQVVDHVDSRDLVEPLWRIARLQAVKCAPYNGRRGAPYAEMWIRCPNMLLCREVSIAKPKVMLTFGTEVFAAVARLAGFEHVPHRGGSLSRGMLTVDDRRVDVLGLRHPAAFGRGWQESQAALIKLLRSRQKDGRLSQRT